jgi:hypothetical protein
MPNEVADKVIEVPNLGTVSFPGTMTDDQVSAAIYKQLNPGKAPATVEQNPGLGQMPGRSNYPLSEGIPEASSLANVAMAGMGGESPMGMPGSTLLSSLGAGTAKLLRAVGANKFASYFADSPGGYTPTPRTNTIAQLHELTGIKPNDLNIRIGSVHPDSVYGTPAEGLIDAGIKPQDLQGLTAEAKVAKVNPAWQKAGQAVDTQAAAATKRGVTLDVGKPIAQAIDDMLDPQGSQALARTVNIFKQTLGEDADWRSLTPSDAVALKRALWQGLPPKFRNPVYGAVTRALNTAAPEMKPTNLAYSQLQQIMEGLDDLRNQQLTRTGPTKFDQMLELMKNPIVRNTGLGAGGTIAGAKTLYDMMKGR